MNLRGFFIYTRRWVSDGYRRQADVCISHIACLLLFVGYNMWGCLKHKIGDPCVRNQSPNLRQRHRWCGGNCRNLSLNSFRDP